MSMRVGPGRLIITAKEIGACMAIGGLMAAAAILGTGRAEATWPVDSCTPDNPSAPYNHICIGNGHSCDVTLVGCSPIPGHPGTWNPRGYTPKIGGVLR